eukprot:1160777-Pelagomonas_calceolata.AAC.4
MPSPVLVEASGLRVWKCSEQVLRVLAKVLHALCRGRCRPKSSMAHCLLLVLLKTGATKKSTAKSMKDKECCKSTPEQVEQGSREEALVPNDLS